MKILILLTSIFVLNAAEARSRAIWSEKLPLWEAGLGMIFAKVPHYPGAEQDKNFVIPIPAFLYRGEVMRSDGDGGIRGRFFNSEFMEINLSLGGSLPADSEDNRAREGMEDLDTILEFGPGLIFHFSRMSKTNPWAIGFNVPLRLAFSTDLKSITDRGVVFNPMLYAIRSRFLNKKSILFTYTYSTWATERYNEYFYQVKPEFVRSDRPVFGAQGGYLLSGVSVALSQGFGKQVTTFLGGVYQNLSSAKNRHSPLFKKKENFSIALGVIWWFLESDTMGAQ